MTQITQEPEIRSDAVLAADVGERPRYGAIGKALIVWLATGSVGAAIVAYLLFAGMGC